eukprot:SM000120S25716  [mRNA]  locus=s120:398087:406079:+ [translate_table: standard]
MRDSVAGLLAQLRSPALGSRKWRWRLAALLLLGGGSCALAARLATTRHRSAPRPARDGSVTKGRGFSEEPDIEITTRKGCTGTERGPRGTSVRSGRPQRGEKSAVGYVVAILATKLDGKGFQRLVALAGLAVCRTVLSNYLARLQGHLFRAAFLRRVPLFGRLIIENIAACLLQSLIFASGKFLKGSLALQWRKVLTEQLHTPYFQNMVFYKISHVDKRITNPDERFSSDVPKFCNELADLTRDNINAICDAVFYTLRLCSYASPKYALGILAYVLGAGLTTGILSPPFGKLMAKEQHLRGEYRQLHARLRTHSESIAFYGGQKREASLILNCFKQLINHTAGVLRTQWRFGMVQDFLLKYCGATWAVVLIIGPFFGGELRPKSTLTGRANMLSQMRYHTSVVISLFQALGTLAGCTRQLKRLSGYAERIKELKTVSQELQRSGSSENSQAHGSIATGDCIAFENVKVITPAGTELVKGLTFQIEVGSNLLITGPNGSGKSSLFRVLGGLWPLVEGRIVTPGSAGDLSHEIFYVPQRPYTSIGTLYDQLIYPLKLTEDPSPILLARMRQLLSIVDLEAILDRYPEGTEVNWSEELSLGEQQRLGMARLIHHRPTFAILDECTSAVTTSMEERFCEQVKAMGTTCVTISHRPALVAFHDMILALDGEGGWSIHKRDGIYDKSDGKQGQLSQTETTGKLDSSSQGYIDTLVQSSPSPGIAPVDTHITCLRVEPQSLATRIQFLLQVLVPSIDDRHGSHLVLLAGLVVIRTLLSDRIASLNGASVSHVVKQDRKAFLRLIGVSVLQSLASSVTAPSLRYLTGTLALRWRSLLTSHLSNLYFSNNAFYKVMHLVEHGPIDADHRIVQDVERLGHELAGLITGAVKPVIDILWFTRRMQQLTGQRGIFILYAYMLVGLGFLRAITPDFGALISHEQQLESNFRFAHTRLRTHAESIAFFGGGQKEEEVVQRRFTDIVCHSQMVLQRRWFFDLADEFVTKQLPHNVTWGLSLLYSLSQPQDLGTAEQGQLAWSMRFLASIVSQSFLAFGEILELYRKGLELAGGITRVAELSKLLTAAQQDLSRSSPLSNVGEDISKSTVLEGESGTPSGNSNQGAQGTQMLRFCGVDVVTPSQKLLVRGLHLTVKAQQSLLVTGPNGSGKSSLFRALGKLWPLAGGYINSVPSESIFYVPQRPYTAKGTLRDQLIYPLAKEEAAASFSGGVVALDERLKAILEDVRLVYLLDREGGWDASPAWEDMLSLGEQQRIGMGRLFFHRPVFGILDECTNAISVDVEEHLYIQAKQLGITVITISQRPALIPYHSLELRLIDGEGAWELRAIQPSGLP